MKRAIFGGLAALVLAPIPGWSRSVPDGRWRALFDGTSLGAWRGFRSPEAPASWEVTDGLLHRKPGVSEDEGGDLCSREQFSSFELELEWRISRGGNSGVKYLVWEERPSAWEKAALSLRLEQLRRRTDPGAQEEIRKETLARYRKAPMGFEYQIVDPDHPDARNGSRRVTAALYDLLPGAGAGMDRAGFNRTRIVCLGGRIEHWLNGVKVLEFRPASAELRRAIAASKFRNIAGFGTIRRGHICLQDHGDEVWFRAIRIRTPTP